MAIEVREKAIGSSNYMVTQMTARRALRVKAKLFKLLGPALGKMLSAKEEFGDHLAKVAKLIIENLDERDFENLILEMMQGVRTNGIEITPEIFDMEFAGNLGSLYQLLWFILEVNYQSFFDQSGIGNLFKESDPQEKASTKKIFTKK